MKFPDWLLRLNVWKDTRGQDMVEYALLAGFVAVAAAASFPPLAEDIIVIFSKVTSLSDQAAAK